MRPNGKKYGGTAQSFRALGAVGAIGLMLVVCTFAGLAAGYTLDRHLDTEPWFTMGLLILGIIAGFINIFQKTIPANRKEKKQWNRYKH